MTGHDASSKGFIMRRPDGTPMSREEVIVQRRGAFKWLPVLCSNDLVHGSWWFVWGSFLTAVFAIYPLIQKHVHLYDQTDDLLPATDFDVTWALIIVSGCFFTLGSLAFVRAFEEPPKEPLFKDYKHLQSDELLAAWLFLFGTMPAVPYMFVFFTIEPSAFYFIGLLAAIIFTIGSYFFVVACYPSDRKTENYLLPLLIRLSGAQMWAVKHLANDWLAGTWFFLWANAIITFGSFLLFLLALSLADPQQIFIWFSGLLCSFLFLVGSLYFVSGSYPHAQQFYYSTSRPHNIPDYVPSHNDRDDDEYEPVAGDELRLLPTTRRSDEAQDTTNNPLLSTANLNAHNKNTPTMKKSLLLEEKEDVELGGFELIPKPDQQQQLQPSSTQQQQQQGTLSKTNSTAAVTKKPPAVPVKKNPTNGKFASPPPPAIMSSSTKSPTFQKVVNPPPATTTTPFTTTTDSNENIEKKKPTQDDDDDGEETKL